MPYEPLDKPPEWPRKGVKAQADLLFDMGRRGFPLDHCASLFGFEQDAFQRLLKTSDRLIRSHQQGMALWLTEELHELDRIGRDPNIPPNFRSAAIKIALTARQYDAMEPTQLSGDAADYGTVTDLMESAEAALSELGVASSSSDPTPALAEVEGWSYEDREAGQPKTAMTAGTQPKQILAPTRHVPQPAPDPVAPPSTLAEDVIAAAEGWFYGEGQGPEEGEDDRVSVV